MSQNLGYRFVLLSAVLGLLVFGLPLGAQQINLEAAGQAAAGSQLSVRWSGPSNPRDFISIDPAGAPERQYGRYIYTREDSSGVLPVPAEPGSYEVRYHRHDDYSILASRPLEVTDVSATLEAIQQAAAGSPVEVRWSGPNNPRDFISIDPAGAPERQYGRYVYVKEGSPQTLNAPDEPGDYEVRYHLGASGYRVIGSSPLEVGEVTATVEAAATALAGSPVEIAWTGPEGSRDFISIDPAGAPERQYGRYVYVKEGSPQTLNAPDEPGDYEVRYHLGQTYRVVGSSALTVTATNATVSAPPTVEGGSVFEVEWSGPDNPRDFITIVPAGTPVRDYGPYAYTRRGNPLRLEAPKEPGDYEVRYATGQRYLTLAATPIEVTPGKIPGSLRVVAAGAAASGSETGGDAPGAVELILDASGSMLQKLDGTRRIELARSALTDLVDDVLPAGTPFALRVFGHRQADACRTDLEIPLAPLDKAAARARIASIEAKNLAKTPIADSLAKVSADLATASGPKVVVLVTDGEETCDGDPEAAITALRQSGIDVRINIVGFAIDELTTKEQFAAWARRGGGSYLEAKDGEALRQAVQSSLEQPFEVLDGTTVVASGVVGGPALELLPGTYTVRVGGQDHQVTVTADEESRLEIGG
ncbi:MAG: VWA domain-containing protein [Acidobacteriota bacterium]